MISINCKVGGSQTELKIDFDRITMVESNGSSKEVFLSSIRSIHVKNDDEDVPDRFLLKVKLYDSFYIYQFSKIHLRDLIKSILLNLMKKPERFSKNVLETDLQTKETFSILKSVISRDDFFKYYKDEAESFNQEIYQQMELVDSKEHSALNHNSGPGGALSDLIYNFINNQALVDVFILLDCSINQFYNYLISSYYFNIKNKQNILDRLLSESVRPHKVPSNYATRINSYSFMVLDKEDRHVDNRKINSRQIDYEPICPYNKGPKSLEERGIPNVSETNLTTEDSPMSRLLDFQPEFIQPRVHFSFDSKDFETARELCKLVYKNKTDQKLISECNKFSARFLDVVEGKYGKDAMKYIERILPTFYM